MKKASSSKVDRRKFLTGVAVTGAAAATGGAAKAAPAPDARAPAAQRPTYENMVGGFRKITESAAPGDQVYIHYSGHGGQTLTIVPAVKGPKALDETLVPMGLVVWRHLKAGAVHAHLLRRAA